MSAFSDAAVPLAIISTVVEQNADVAGLCTSSADVAAVVLGALHAAGYVVLDLSNLAPDELNAVHLVANGNAGGVMRPRLREHAALGLILGRIAQEHAEALGWTAPG